MSNIRGKLINDNQYEEQLIARVDRRGKDAFFVDEKRSCRSERSPHPVLPLRKQQEQIFVSSSTDMDVSLMSKAGA